MNDHFSRRPLWIASIVMLMLGSIMTIRSLVGIRAHHQRLQRYADYSRELARLETDIARVDAAVARFEQVENPHPEPLTHILNESLPGQAYETRERPAPATIPGWNVKRIEVSFADAQLSAMSDFIVAAESRRPPWHLSSCTIQSLNPSGGSGHVTLVLEALDKER